jgi:hypothetical protein
MMMMMILLTDISLLDIHCHHERFGEMRDWQNPSLSSFSWILKIRSNLLIRPPFNKKREEKIKADRKSKHLTQSREIEEDCRGERKENDLTPFESFFSCR